MLKAPAPVPRSLQVLQQAANLTPVLWAIARWPESEGGHAKLVFQIGLLCVQQQQFRV